ncbi:MAG: isocitrate lyase/PEP mutase family protein [Proteobacteria bacterium]|nr:isocitrate lyase/PEP mutase family protein [Pseudomonadota bacterium]
MAETFDDLLKSSELLILPGAFDSLSARLAVRAGARAVYMTGFGVVGASFGVPDIGLIGPEQMTERVFSIAASIAPVPLIADGDNGHGNVLNAAPFAQAYEKAGAQAIQLEDQVSPKRCGHMEGKEVVPVADAAAKIRAAVSARANTAFKIIARTDARATHDLAEALRRGEAFLKAGADVLFIEAPQSEGELRKIGETFRGTPLLANLVEDGKTPWATPAALKAYGYKIALYPISALLVAAKRLEVFYAALLSSPAPEPQKDRVSFAHYNDIVDLPELRKRAIASEFEL